MSRTKILLLSGVLGLIVVVLGVAWWLGYFSDTPDEVSIDASVAAVTEAAEGEAEDGNSDSSDDTEAAPAASIDNIDGTWTVQPNAAATFVGYRINEVLTTIGDFEVVGRTSDVTGTLEAGGTSVSAVTLVADMTTLTTDNDRRDSAMRSQALETSTFPEATFELTAPIELGTIPAVDEIISVTATGDLMIHGVTQSVDFPLSAVLIEESIVVTGQLQIQMADYGIDAPQAPIVASVEDVAVLELSVVFGR